MSCVVPFELVPLVFSFCKLVLIFFGSIQIYRKADFIVFYPAADMDLSTKESRYETLNKRDALDDLDDLDLENDSDTTLASSGFLAKKSERLSRYEKSSKLSTALTWVRWSVVVILQGIILFLLMPSDGLLDMGWNAKKTETGGDINGLYIPSEILSQHCIQVRC
jgi:hypothetical protein